MPENHLQEDDAARHLASLTPEERRPVDPLTTPDAAPQPSPPSFTEEERAAAEALVAPGCVHIGAPFSPATRAAADAFFAHKKEHPETVPYEELSPIGKRMQTGSV